MILLMNGIQKIMDIAVRFENKNPNLLQRNILKSVTLG